MTAVIINDVLPLTQLIATNLQTVFDATWTADVASDVVVYARATGVAANDSTQLIAASNYNVTFVGSENIVRVTFLVGRTTSDVVTLTRATPSDRDNLYINTNFTPSMLNGDFGRLVMIDQQSQMFYTEITPRYNTSETLNSIQIDCILPLLPASGVWRKNAANTAITSVVVWTQGELASYTAPSGASLIGLEDQGAVVSKTLQDLAEANFICQSSNNTLVNAQFLNLLTPGVMQQASGIVSTNIPLTSLGAISIASDQTIYGTAANTYAATALTVYARTLIAAFDATAARVVLGLVIGTNVQAYDATLQSIAALGTAADKMIYTTGVDTWAEAAFPSYSKSLIANTTLGAWQSQLGIPGGGSGVYLPLAGGTMTGSIAMGGNQITDLAEATLSSDAVTLGQVINLVQNVQLACVVMTTVDLAGWIYDNGVSGVGATLTANINGATTFDTSIIPTVGQRVLVNLQVDQTWQGSYTIVQGTLGTPTVLTRSTDYNQASEMQAGDTFSVISGTDYAATQWMMSQTSAITVGTTAITFNQISGQGALLKANNLSDLLSAATSRTNLGLAIGTNVQAYDATLQSISSLGTAANKMIYTTGIDTWAETGVTLFGRTMLALVAANGAIPYSDATTAQLLAPTATSGQMFRSGSNSAPSWSTATFPSTAGTSGNVITSDGTNFVSSAAASYTGFESSMLLMGG